MARIQGAEGSDSIFGSGVADVIYGGAGNDTIYGGIGADTLNGDTGDDVLIAKADGFNTVDTFNGGAGNDTILATSSVLIDWSKTSSIEAVNGNGYANVFITGSSGSDVLNFSSVSLTGVARLDGGAGDDLITGTSGDDAIYGGAGTDTLNGGDGNDILIIKADASSDQYNGDGGTDTLTALSSASIDLAKLNSIEAINGNGFANVSINGTAGDDTLDLSGYSLSGIARINSGLGNDVIIGSADNDTIVGGAGSDTLTGGSGNDVFSYPSTSQSTAAAPDHITDFAVGDDKIDLSALDANTATAGVQAFTWSSASTFVANAPGTVIAYDDGAGHTIIAGNVNNDTVADFTIVIDNNAGIGFSDFLGVNPEILIM